MIDLKPVIARINALLQQNTDQSVTYAALEARLALEKVCYDRLRQRHDYISHADLRSWRPAHVINNIMTEVDQYVGQTMTLMIEEDGNKKSTVDGFVPIGTEIGFDSKKIATMWNTLTSVALHVRLPMSRKHEIQDYGDKNQISIKVKEVVTELERLAQGTMVYSGFGEEVHFDCQCGTINKRRSNLLLTGQPISCYNPECRRSFLVDLTESGVRFIADVIEIPCFSCEEINVMNRRDVAKIDRGASSIFSCVKCSYKNTVTWLFDRIDPKSTQGLDLVS